MSKFLQRLFKEVLDKFPFSISGYHNPEGEYEDFFHRICKFQESLKDNNKIHFTISGFAKLKMVSSNIEKELDEWKTAPLKFLLFNDNYLGFSEPILSLYITLLQHLSADKRVVNILAGNVNNSILIKILLNEKLDKIHFSFIKSDNTLLIEVPLSYFKSIKNGKKDSLQDLFKNINETDFIVKREGISSSYSIDPSNKEKTEKFQSILNELLDLNSIEIISNLSPENVYHTLLIEVFKKDKYIAKEIYSLIFASAVLCYFYDCSLTYFVSTARVANDKRYTLGAMGIGLKSGNELSDKYKALYSILANHLASNLATQIIFESSKRIQLEYEKNRFFEFCEILNDTIDKNKKVFTPKESRAIHGNDQLANGTQNKIRNLISNYKNCLGEDFENKVISNFPNKFSKYLTVICDKSKQSAANTNIIFENKCKFKEVDDENCFYCRLYNAIADADEKFDHYLNIPLMDKLIMEFETHPNTLFETFVIQESILNLNYTSNFNLSEFIYKLNNTNSRGFTSLLKMNCLPILSAGNFCISNISGDEIFNLLKWYLGENNYHDIEGTESGFKIQLSFNYKIA